MGSRTKEKFSKTQKEYDQELAIKRPGIIRLGDYLGHAINIKHQCVCGNSDWYPRPANILGSGDTCGCAQGFKSEKVIRQIFQQIFKSPFPKVRPNFLKRPGSSKNIELDGYSEGLKIAFEHHGSQHYGFNNLYHESKKDFKNQLSRDEIKKDLCKKAGVLLVIIPTIENRLRKIRNNPLELNKLYKEILEILINNGLKPVNSPKKVTIDWKIIEGS